MKFTGKLIITRSYDVGGELDVSKIAIPEDTSIEAVKRIVTFTRVPKYVSLTPDMVLKKKGTERINVPNIGMVYASIYYQLYRTGVVSVNVSMKFQNAESQTLCKLSELDTGNVTIDGKTVSFEAFADELYNKISSPIMKGIKETYTVKVPPEDYTYIIIDKVMPCISGSKLLQEHGKLFAAFLRGETDWRKLSNQEVKSALSGILSYTTRDFVAVDWDAAVIYGASETEQQDILNTLQMVNNVRLEFRVFEQLLLQQLGKFNTEGNVKSSEIGESHMEIIELIREVRTGLEGGEYYLGRLYSLAAEKLQIPQLQKRVFELKEDLKNYSEYIGVKEMEKRDRRMTAIWVLLGTIWVIEFILTVVSSI